MKASSCGALALLLVTFGSGCAMQRDHEALSAKTAEIQKDLDKTRADLAAAKSDLEATRQRLDNALRATADSGTDSMAAKAKLNDLGGRMEEANHHFEVLEKEVANTRTELYARIDEIKRAQVAAAVPVAPPPTVAIPNDKAAHFKALEDAHARRDWTAVRALGPEYVNHYPTDDRTDDALYLMGSADLADGRPSSALGHYNRVIKLFPKSNVLDKTLFDIGEAYMLMHDCTNAKLAYDACEKRFAKDKLGDSSRAKLGQIAKNPPGLCAPQ
jgi:TolA-binding protein